MPNILEIREIDGAAWVRIGKPGDFPSGVALWTPAEQLAAAKAAADWERETILVELEEVGAGWAAAVLRGRAAK